MWPLKAVLKIIITRNFKHVSWLKLLQKYCRLTFLQALEEISNWKATFFFLAAAYFGSSLLKNNSGGDHGWSVSTAQRNTWARVLLLFSSTRPSFVKGEAKKKNSLLRKKYQCPLLREQLPGQWVTSWSPVIYLLSESQAQEYLRNDWLELNKVVHM